MTLPNPDKPDISDTIETIVTDIQENCAYLDTNPSAYTVSYFTRAVGAGEGYEIVSGVGFEPRVILLFGISYYGGTFVGYYGPSAGADQFCFARARRIIDGFFYSDTWGYSKDNIVNIFDRASVGSTNYGNYVLAQVYSTYDDGYVLYFNEIFAQIVEDYYFVSLCIK